MQSDDRVCVPDDTFYVGRVKWFNNQAGYGFIEMAGASDTKDIFVHHSAIRTTVNQFRYLVEGEYVRFKLGKGNGKYTVSSWDVTGPNGGKLMCETRSEKSRDRSSTSETAEEIMVCLVGNVTTNVVDTRNRLPPSQYSLTPILK